MTTRLRRPVAMLAHTYYEEDPRVRREAESLVASGRPVDVYSLRQPGETHEATIDGVRVVRLDVQRHQGAAIGTYLSEYGAFFARAGWAVTGAHRRRRYAVVQVHSLPDGLAFAALPLRLVGVPIILDLHESMPEFFRSRFPAADDRLWRRLLRAQERAAIAISSAVLTVNDALRDRLLDLGVRPDKVTVIANSPDLARFDPAIRPARPFMAGGRLRLVYAGALSPIYELDVALTAAARIAERRPELGVAVELYGRDFGEVDLHGVVRDLGIGDRVTFHGRIPIADVPAAVAAADIGLAPTRRTRFTDFSLSTKLYEYAAMGKPVVASRLPMVERTFGHDSVVTYEPGDAGSMAAAILGLVDDPADRARRVERTGAIVEASAWGHESVRYRAIVERLAADGLSSAGPSPDAAPTTPAEREESP